MPVSTPTLQALVPALPLAAAILTMLLGRRLGHRAHLPAVFGIAGAAVAAVMLLLSTHAIATHEIASHGADAGHGDPHSAAAAFQTAKRFDSPATLWHWATIDEAIVPSPAATPPGTPLSAPNAGGSAAAIPFSIPIQLRLDPLTATMLALVTCVGLLVAIYSIGYMSHDPDYARFFSLVALFVFSMTMLVSATNFLVVYVFWEAVGACSYLLIGFWFRKPEAARAAKKAFLVNRVGDFGLAIAVFLIWMTYGTLNFHDVTLADGSLQPGVLGVTRLEEPGRIVGGAIGTVICLCLLLAACGKSAQAPLHVWLPDAMEGPTPASSLIHAATMVTAGIYLVARCAPLFEACPGALVAVSLVGAVTALLAGLIATVQNDLKRVLAYSTISQLGYMFVSLGTGTLLGFTAAIFHLVTHAFFKALLFMGAGSVMHSMGGVIDMRRFGGLRRIMPITAATFLVGSLALAGVPPFAGFFSKDEILASLHAKAFPGGHDGHHEPSTVATVLQPVGFSARLAANPTNTPATNWLDGLDRPTVWRAIWWMAILTAGLTAFYTFRAVFMTFSGPERVPEEAAGHDHAHGGSGPHESPPVMTIPLCILAAASAVSGWWLFSTHALSDFLAVTPSLAAPAVAATAVPHAFHVDIAIQGTLAAAIGIAVAAIGHLGRRSDGPQMERFLGPLEWLFANRFFIDQLYSAFVVKPLEALAFVAAAFDRFVIDGTVDAVGRLPVAAGSLVRGLQSGLVQRYALAGASGVLLIVLALFWRLRG